MRSASGRCDRPLLTDLLPILGVLLLSFIASSIPGQRLPPLGQWNLDKVVHGFEFALIGATLMRPLGRAALGLSPGLQVLCATCLGAAWGALDELHQLFTPNRSSDVRDWVADVTGALVGALLVLGWRRLRAGTPGAAAEAPR
jgi:VanZ family protein